jgi:hypothetical protein
MEKTTEGLNRHKQQINRYNRAMTQPLYLLDKYYENKDENNDGTIDVSEYNTVQKQTKQTKQHIEESNYNYNHLVFKICGSTKNVYTIELKNSSIICDCPDYISGCVKHQVICKHCCFVLFKVLHLLDDIFEPIKYDKQIVLMEHQINYLKQRFSTIIMSIQLNNLRNDTLIDETMLNKYQHLKKNNEIANKNENIVNEPKCHKNKFVYTGDLTSAKEKNNDCPICFCEFDLATKIAICPVCKNILHVDCAKKWINMGKTSCVYCRSNIWKDYKKEELNEGKVVRISPTKYTNLE